MRRSGGGRNRVGLGPAGYGRLSVSTRLLTRYGRFQFLTARNIDRLVLEGDSHSYVNLGTAGTTSQLRCFVFFVPRDLRCPREFGQLSDFRTRRAERQKPEMNSRECRPPKVIVQRTDANLGHRQFQLPAFSVNEIISPALSQRTRQGRGTRLLASVREVNGWTGEAPVATRSRPQNAREPGAPTSLLNRAVP